MQDKLKIIQELMEELQDAMEHSPEDLDERLGRKKPDVEVVKIEGEMPIDEDEMMVEEDEESPEEKLKKRLMKLRGE